VHTFDTPFLWDGVSNLLVDISYGGNTFGSGGMPGMYYSGFGGVNDISWNIFHAAGGEGPMSLPSSGSEANGNTIFEGYLPDMVFVINSEGTLCFAPTALAAVSVTDNSAELQWAEPASAPSVGYDWEVRTTGEPFSGDGLEAASGSVAAGTAQASATGLSATTSYTAYIRSDCGEGTYSSVSVVLFTTAYPAGQIAITLGEGTNANSPTAYPTPYGKSYGNQRVQYLILASELIDLGYTTGSISGLEFNVISLNGLDAMNNFSVELAHTTATDLSSGYAAFSGSTPGEDYTSVLYNPNFIPTTGWNNHTFDQPLQWDGVSNLVVDICFETDGSYNANASVYYTATSFVSSRWYRNDATQACGNTSTTSTSSNRANLHLVGNFSNCIAPVSLQVDNIGATTADVQWTEPDPAPSVGYDWEVRTSGTPFSGDGLEEASGSVAAGTSQASVSGLSATTNYTAYVRSDCGGGTYSDVESLPFTTSSAETIVTIGTQEFVSVAETMPLSLYIADDYGDRTQVIYSSNELIAAGANAGDITEIRLEVVNLGTTPSLTNFSIRMKNISYDNFITGLPFENTGLITVYSVASYTPVTGMNSHVFDIPFSWDGSSHILLDLCFDAIEGTMNAPEMYYSSGAASDIYWNVNPGFAPPEEPICTSAAGLSLPPGWIGIKPDISFVMSGGGSACNAPTALAAVSVTDNSAELQWTEPDPAPSVGYDWEVRTTGTPFSGDGLENASGSVAAGTAQASVSGLSATTNYTAYVRSDCGGGTYSDIESLPFTTSSAETIVTIGTQEFESNPGTGSGYALYNSGPSEGMRNQMIYKASDLIAAGASAGNITEIRLEVTSLGDMTDMTDFNIRLKNTSADYYDVSLAFDNLGLTTVYNVDVYQPIQGENVHTFDTPFLWDGVSNLLVDICYGGNTSGSGGMPGMYHTRFGGVNDISWNLFHAEGGEGPMSLPSSGSEANGNTTFEGFLPDMTFVINSGGTLCFAPTALLVASITDNSAELQWTEPDPAASVGYEWEVRTTGEAFSGDGLEAASGSVASGTSQATVTGLSATTSYTAYIRSDCGEGTYSSVSAVLFTTAYPAGQIAITLGDGTNANSPTGYPTPYGKSYGNQRVQYLILASELIDMGYTTGSISGLEFNVSSLNGLDAMNNFSVELAHTTATDLSSGYAAFSGSTPGVDYTSVLYNPDFMPIAGWNNHTFDQPLQWDGVSNLVVDICF
jgi:hypothetical protein